MARVENDGFRKLLGQMMVAAYRQDMRVDMRIISDRLRDAQRRGMTELDALKAHVLAGLSVANGPNRKNM